MPTMRPIVYVSICLAMFARELHVLAFDFKFTFDPSALGISKHNEHTNAGERFSISGSEMSQAYLSFDWSSNTSSFVDVIMSIRSSGPHKVYGRNFYRPWLHYFPTRILRNFIFLSEPGATETSELAECLPKCEAVPIVVKNMTDFHHYFGNQYEVREAKKFTSWYAIQMQAWKFDADRVATAPIIAFTDDDSCMLDHLLPSEIVNSKGQLIARGWEFAQNKIVGIKRQVSMKPIGFRYDPPITFMTDFPVYVWREMLADFRAAIVYYLRNKWNDRTEYKGMDEAFWTLLGREYRRGWKPSEYDQIMNFAYHSRKWHSRYDWQIVFVKEQNHSHPILGHSEHHTSCAKIDSPGGRAPIRSRDIEAFTKWSQQNMLYPRSLHEIENSDQKHLKRQNKMDPEWISYVTERQKALSFYAKQQETISASDSCGAKMVGEWETCFEKFSTWGG
mmetsp:Transcript_10509/g.24432  ORF Transcript_10509/g.24432 Transcript_10509/m.24432 type:complete len:448 (-) Transcript_10509:192-1535(-)